MYLPWPGLFDQVRHADLFVHYDDVQLPQGRSFCTRVQVKTNDTISWLSVPLTCDSRGLIYEALIDHSQNWKIKHANKLKESLSKAPFWEEAQRLLHSVFEKNILSLSDLNIAFIETIADYLGLKAEFQRSASLGLTTKSTQRLIDICNYYKGTTYITGHGAKNYLDHPSFEANGIDVKYMNYCIAPYKQKGTFTPYVTILDLIAYTGQEAIHHLQSTHLPWRTFVNHE